MGWISGACELPSTDRTYLIELSSSECTGGPDDECGNDCSCGDDLD